MEANYVHKDTLTATDYVELNKNNELLISYNQALLKENQELKKRLKVPKACNLKTLEDYKSYYEDTTREQILEDTYIEYCAYVNLAHRYSELKKQLEERTKMYQNAYDYSQKMEGKTIILETQQQEFINYLEKKISAYAKAKPFFVEHIQGSYNLTQLELYMLKEVLANYREIIGDNK